MALVLILRLLRVSCYLSILACLIGVYSLLHYYSPGLCYSGLRLVHHAMLET